MNFFLSNIVFFVFFSLSSCFSQERIQAIIPIFKNYIQKNMSAWQTPAVAVAVVYKGQIVFQETFGVKNIETQEPIDNHTVFPVASLTKTFLAALIAQLVDEGKVKWEDPVRKYIPTFFVSNEDVSSEFTVEDLLSHRSGLPGFAGDTFMDLGFSQSDLLNALAKIPLKKPFRNSYAYQNHMFSVASLVAEKATGKDIATLFSERFFTPLGMADSSASYHAVASGPWWKRLLGNKKNVVSPHTLIKGKMTPIPIPKELYVFPGTSGVNLSLHDATQWLLFQLNNLHQEGGPKISAQQVTRMRTPHIPMLDIRPTDMQFSPKRFSNLFYGLGYFIHDFGADNKKIHGLGHMGAFSSVRSLIFMAPEENLGLVMLCNVGGLRVSTFLEALRDKFLDLYLGIDGEDWSQTNLQIMNDIQTRIRQEMVAMKVQNPRPHSKLESYQGVFTNDLYGTLIVGLKDGRLYFRLRDKTVLLTHWNGNQFAFDAPDLSPAYSSNDHGILEFGFRGGKASLLAVNMLHEGSQLFQRVGEEKEG